MPAQRPNQKREKNKMPSISINIEKDLFSVVKKRAKKNYLSIQELIEDIIRRSMLSYAKRSKNGPKVDDKLVGIFSRERRGRKKKK